MDFFLNVLASMVAGLILTIPAAILYDWYPRYTRSIKRNLIVLVIRWTQKLLHSMQHKLAWLDGKPKQRKLAFIGVGPDGLPISYMFTIPEDVEEFFVVKGIFNGINRVMKHGGYITHVSFNPC